MSVAGSDCGDSTSIAGRVELGHRALGEVAAVGDLPFVVGIVQHGANKADDGGLVGEDADDPGSAFDLPVESFDRVRNGYEGVSVTGPAGVSPLVVGVGAGLRCDRPGRGALGVKQGG